MRQSKVRHRPTPRKRCREDGRPTVKEILARNAAGVAMLLVGCSCVTLPIATGIAGSGCWPLAVAYGGCLVGIALSGEVER